MSIETVWDALDLLEETYRRTDTPEVLGHARRELNAVWRACVVIVRAKALEHTSSMPSDLVEAIRLIQRIGEEEKP